MRAYACVCVQTCMLASNVEVTYISMHACKHICKSNTYVYTCWHMCVDCGLVCTYLLRKYALALNEWLSWHVRLGARQLYVHIHLRARMHVFTHMLTYMYMCTYMYMYMYICLCEEKTNVLQWEEGIRWNVLWNICPGMSTYVWVHVCKCVREYASICM